MLPYPLFSLTALGILLSVAPVLAQHEHHQMAIPADTVRPASTTPHDHHAGMNISGDSTGMMHGGTAMVVRLLP